MRAVAIYIPVPTSAFTLAPLVARRGGTPCSTLHSHRVSFLNALIKPRPMKPRKAIRGNRHSEKLKHIKNQITGAPRTCMARPSCPAIRSIPHIMRVRRSVEMDAARGVIFSFNRM